MYNKEFNCLIVLWNTHVNNNLYISLLSLIIVSVPKGFKTVIIFISIKSYYKYLTCLTCPIVLYKIIGKTYFYFFYNLNAESNESYDENK